MPPVLAATVAAVVAACLALGGPRLWLSGVAGAAGRHAGHHHRGGVRRSASTALRAEGTALPVGIRVGVLVLPGRGVDYRTAFEKLNVTNETYFQTEVPDAFQMPFAAKLLAMSNTVDVIVAVHGDVLPERKPEILRGYQTVALTTNVAIVPCDTEDVSDAASVAVQMGEIRQQALLGGGPRRTMFFGIGKNQTDTKPVKKEKVYF